MFKRIFTLFFLLIGFGSFVYGQTYNGPAQGSVSSGAMVSTDDFSKPSHIIIPYERIGEDDFEINEQVNPIDFGFPMKKEGSNYYEDPAFNGQSINEAIMLKNFQGIPDQGSYIPPDPYCAVGPNNIVATVNSRFRIFDKDGNVLKTIEADNWFSNVFPNAGSFDPKVQYDAIDQRWIMVWLQQNDGVQTATLLLSVSDDSDPLGTWYNWALPANLNGTTNSNTWSDYQGVGYDQDAIYITSSQFTFTGFYQYTKIRIIPKAQLYANTGGAVVWNDIWNIALNGSPFHLRPAIMHTTASKYYLLYVPNPQSIANFCQLYSITDPLGTPALSGVNIPVTPYYSAPLASQLGGSTIAIETGGSAGQNEPKYRDGYLYFVHTVRNPTNAQYSSIHFLKINVNTNVADQDFVFGSDGKWYFYPAMDVDADGNIGLTFSRSGNDEYIGAYLTTRLAGDTAGFNASVPLKLGEANYVKDFGAGRNRWGDYNGLQTDPVDQNNFWLFTEYAASPANTWGSWVGEIRAQLYPGAHIFSRTNRINLENTEINYTSSPKEIKLYNFGSDDLVITSIPDSVGPFHTVNVPSGTITIPPYDSLSFDVVFSPVNPGLYNLTLEVESNDPDFQGIDLEGNGYQINQVVRNTMYASSGINTGGLLLNVNLLTGQADSIGSSNYDDVDYISEISINQVTQLMYGLYVTADSSYLLRVNPLAGDAYRLYTLDLTDLKSLAFDTTGTLYLLKKSGELYTLELNNGSYTQVASTGVTLSSIAFDPATNILYASALVNIGANKDRLYKIDLPSGNPTIIGNTGFNVVTNAIEFDAFGNLYGVIGSSSAPNNLIQIDKTTGAGTTVGSLGYPEITGLSFARMGVTGVKPNNETLPPKDFSLKQNYPNPFNPSTTIEYSLPVASNVTVTIYNLLGEVVFNLAKGQQNAGYHSAIWNSNDLHGSKVGSGVYFYELKANGSNGSQFTQIRKMILLK